MVHKTQKNRILPYHLRVDIWDLIDKNSTTEEIVENLYEVAPTCVSESQFIRCIQAIRGKHIQGQRPSEK